MKTLACFKTLLEGIYLLRSPISFVQSVETFKLGQILGFFQVLELEPMYRMLIITLLIFMKATQCSRARNDNLSCLMSTD